MYGTEKTVHVQDAEVVHHVSAQRYVADWYIISNLKGEVTKGQERIRSLAQVPERGCRVRSSSRGRRARSIKDRHGQQRHE